MNAMTGGGKSERMRRVAIAGASGYTGAELLRLLLQHPLTKVVALTAETHANQPIGKVFPSLAGFLDLACLPLDTAKLAAEAEFVFLALPHKTSMAVVEDLIQRGARVLDLSADYRLKDAAAYPRWYGVEHVAPHLLKEAAYGLPELHRAEIADARLVAVPGCTTAGLPAIVPVAVMPEATVTLATTPPRSTWLVDNTFPALSNCTGLTVSDALAPNIAAKFAPVPAGPFRTNPEGVSVTVPEPER